MEKLSSLVLLAGSTGQGMFSLGSFLVTTSMAGVLQCQPLSKRLETEHAFVLASFGDNLKE